jgi:hypothetical protein
MNSARDPSTGRYTFWGRPWRLCSCGRKLREHGKVAPRGWALSGRPRFTLAVKRPSHRERAPVTS